MDLPRLIEVLADPAAYPHPVGAVEVRQTHISAVFLAGPYAYHRHRRITPVAPASAPLVTRQSTLQAHSGLFA